MRREPKHSTFLLDRTVPMLFVIGAVLSVLLLLFSDRTPWKIVLFVLWGVLALGGTVWFLMAAIRRKKAPSVDRAEAERDRFLSDVAHELKTPLTVIRGCAEVLSDQSVPPEQYVEYGRRIQTETEAMSRLVSDLLDVSRLRSGRIRFELRDVELTYLCRGVCDSLNTVAEKKEVTVRFVASEREIPVLLLDYDRVRQLLVILLDNAVKHSPAGSEVVLQLSRSDDTVILSVSDHGGGIAAEDLPYVFDRFYKADASRGGLSVGSGIGLAIAKEIVLLHGGSIVAENGKDKGAVFTAILPLKEYDIAEE